MKRFKNILYVLDQKSLAKGASAGKVAALARLNDARVTALLLDDVGHYDILSKKLTGKYEKVQEMIKEDHAKNLNQYFSSELWDNINVEIDLSPTSGFIPVIQKVLRDKHDLVIKEDSRKKGIDQFTMRLVRKCPCPVWVIKQSAGDFKRILAAVDLEANYPETEALNQKIIELTHSLAQREQGEAHYVNCWRLEFESWLSSPRFKLSPEEIISMKSDISTERREQLLQLLQKNTIHCKEDQIHILEGLFLDVIKNAISNLRIDLVVMGSVGRSGIPGFLIGNRAEKLLNSITCSALTVKPDGFVSPVTLD
ncbi:universal stress protein [Desulfosediminicola sp.]|uniref:universal stress protein n=1 Tax=Desulfosediminicola sp. TaxID=2886825 RepID=UPI003AF2EB8E